MAKHTCAGSYAAGLRACGCGPGKVVDVVRLSSSGRMINSVVRLDVGSCC